MRCAYLDESELTMQDQPSGKFAVGNLVFVPNAVDWIWKPEITIIEKTAIENGNVVYYARCNNRPMDNSSTLEKRWYAFDEKEVFATIPECQEYISNHYYGGLCNGCKYDKVGGARFFCGDCEFCKPDERYTDATDKRHGTLKCNKSNVIVGNKYRIPGQEICKYYNPKLPQHKRDYVSWENYDDILRNCDFNPKCRHHTVSAHKTCTYERYMDQIIIIPFSFEFNGRKVKDIRIHRSQWIDQTFIDVENQTVKCVGLDYHYELNGHGKPKKECYPLKEWFGEVTTIDVTNGTITDGSDCDKT